MAVAKNRKLATARGMSIFRARASGLPESTDSIRANSSSRASMRSAIASRRRERSAAGVRDQPANAASAARTARSMSAASLSGTSEYGSPVAGSTLSRNFPAAGSTSVAVDVVEDLPHRA